MRQDQEVGNLKVPNVIHAATIDPRYYEMLAFWIRLVFEVWY